MPELTGRIELEEWVGIPSNSIAVVTRHYIEDGEFQVKHLFTPAQEFNISPSRRDEHWLTGKVGRTHTLPFPDSRGYGQRRFGAGNANPVSEKRDAVVLQRQAVPTNFPKGECRQHIHGHILVRHQLEAEDLQN